MLGCTGTWDQLQGGSTGNDDRRPREDDEVNVQIPSMCWLASTVLVLSKKRDE